MKAVVPPNAWQALVEKEEENTPITEDHFREAAKELRALELDPELKREVADTLRIQYKEFTFNGPRRYNKR